MASDSRDLVAYERAIAASNAAHTEEAISLFNASAVANPTWAAPVYLLGAEYASLGEFERAEGQFLKALELEPNLSMCRYQLGLLQFTSDRTVQALSTWEPLLELGGPSPLPSLVNGFSLIVKNKVEGAVSRFLEARILAQGNLALLADIDKIINSLASKSESSVKEVTISENLNSASESDDDHVLIANYRTSDSIH